MTKKTSSKSYKSGRRRTRKKRRSVNTRSIVIFTGFVLFIGLLLYGLNSLRNEVANNNDLVNKELFNSRVEEIDKSLFEVLFRLGISKNDIVKERVAEQNQNGLSWNSKTLSVLLKGGYTEDQIQKTFDQLIPGEEATISIEPRNGQIVSEINIMGYKTHEINFKVKKQEKPLPRVKNEAKSEKQEKTKKTAANTSRKPNISIIVDDVGINKNAVDQLVNISNGLTFAILPNRSYSNYAAEKANNNNIDILLHQPMEPKLDSGYSADDAGEGVLLVGQTKEEILNTLNTNLSSLPNVVGVNNHMGSKFTENKELMTLIMKNIKQKDMIFVDSLTSPESKGYVAAKEAGVKTVKRDIFLDDKTQGKSYVKKQLRKLVSKAQKNGYAVGICHTYPQTIQALREEIPNISQEVNIKSVSNLYN